MLGAYPLDPARIWGGVQAAYAYLVKGLTQVDDLDLHLLTLRPAGHAGPDQIEQAHVTLHLLPAYPRWERLRNYRRYQASVNRQLAQIRPHLLHAQDAGAEALVALRSGYPTVVTVHGIRWEDGKHYSTLFKRLRVYYDSFLTERYVVRHVRHMIAISPYVTRYFRAMLRPDVEVYALANAIDERYFNLEPGQPGLTILFAGRVIPRKRVMDLVQAFSRLLSQVPAARLHIAGETRTEPAYVESIRRWVHAAQLDEQVRFLGALPETALLREFAGCSVVALPSAQETAPMVIAQAMSAGKPVVATRVGGVGDMLGEDAARGLLVEVGDIERLAAAFTRLLQQPDLRAQMGRSGRAFAREHYHLEQVARRTSEVYRHMAFKEQAVHA